MPSARPVHDYYSHFDDDSFRRHGRGAPMRVMPESRYAQSAAQRCMIYFLKDELLRAHYTLSFRERRAAGVPRQLSTIEADDKALRWPAAYITRARRRATGHAPFR